MRLEKCAKDSGYDIYKCKRMWCVKSFLRESFKGSNQMLKKKTNGGDGRNKLMHNVSITIIHIEFFLLIL